LWNTPFWSLCVEIHFYLLVAAVVGLGGRRALWLLPAVCAAITAARVIADAPVSNYTHLRADEILAGACLALWQTAGPLGGGRLVRAVRPWIWVVLLVAASSPFAGPLQFARPYAAALLVGSTLVQPDRWLSRQLLRPTLAYLATISYALYVLHPITYRGLMDEGSAVVRYLVKRPISLMVLFALAHLSTTTWEAWWIGLGKRLTTRRRTA
jgi:peptidoglycan/LPS O-acetylase OafA/YrhL